MRLLLQPRQTKEDKGIEVYHLSVKWALYTKINPQQNRIPQEQQHKGNRSWQTLQVD